MAAVATRVLIEHLGIAAQFVVEDAMDATAAGEAEHDNEEVHMRTFLINLAQQLPPNLPTEQIRQSIVKHYSQSASSSTSKRGKS